MHAEDTLAARLGRLTAREKECLRRCLLPQTAKEMAAELGISPHAVEKRLKMARAKLGVSSSLAAARMLARVEGYQALVPQASDLSERLSGAEDAPPAVVRKHFASGHLLGGLGMLALLLFVASLAQTMRSSADSERLPVLENGRPIATRKASFDEATAFNREDFGHKDRDGSGYLDPQEASALEPRDDMRDKSLPPPPATGQRDPAAEAKWMAKLDTDRDGRVSENEFVGYMLPWTLASGVPTGWHPKTAN